MVFAKFARIGTRWHGLIEVNGLLVDARYVPKEVQEIAFEKGFIPYVPGKKQDIH